MNNKAGFRLYDSDTEKNAETQRGTKTTNEESSNSDFEQFFEFMGITTTKSKRKKKKKEGNGPPQISRSQSTQSLARTYRDSTSSKSSTTPSFLPSQSVKLSQSTSRLTPSSSKPEKEEKRKSLLSLKKSLEQKKLSLACERGDIQSLRSIINKYRDKRKNTKLLRSLLEFEDTDNNNRTALIYCIMGNNVECLLELLRNNVNLEHYVSGSTPLYHATSRGNMECVEELLIYGANPDAINVKGWTSLMIAAYFGHRKIVKLLLKYGADPGLLIYR